MSPMFVIQAPSRTAKITLIMVLRENRENVNKYTALFSVKTPREAGCRDNENKPDSKSINNVTE